MQLCIFEDDRYRNLEPLSLYRPTFELVCGKNTLREKILLSYPGIKYSLLCRAYLAPLLEAQNPGIEVNNISDDDCLFINGNTLASKDLSVIIPIKRSHDLIYQNGDNLIAVHLSGKNLQELKKHLDAPIGKSNFTGLPVENVEVKSMQYIWDLIYHNSSELVSDFELYSSAKTVVARCFA